MATINSGNSTTLYSTTQTTTSVNTAPTLPQDRVNETNFTTLYSNTSASATGGGTSGNLLVSGNLRVLGTSDLEGAVTIGNSYILPTSDGTSNQVIVTDGNGNLTFQDVEAIDNIPNGTAKGQVLYWDGANWLANTTLTFDVTANRLRLVNNTSGGITALDLLKQYTTTLADGSRVAQLFGFYDGSTLSSSNPRYTHRITSEYDTGGNPIYEIDADPVGNFAASSAYNQLQLSNDLLGINGSQLILLGNVTGAPTQDAVIRVNRGSSTDATITWDETNEERWELNNDLLATGLQGGNIQIAMTGQTDSTIYIGGDDLQINTDGSHVIQSNSPIQTTAESMSINSDGTANDSQLNFKSTTQYLKWNNATNQFELSNGIFIGGNVFVNGNYSQTGESITMNNDSTAADSYLYMKGTTESLKWNDADSRFEFSDQLYISQTDIPAILERRSVTADINTSLEFKSGLRLTQRITDAANNDTTAAGPGITFSRTSGASATTERVFASLGAVWDGASQTVDYGFNWSDDNFAEPTPGNFPGTYTLLRMGSYDTNFYNNSVYIDYGAPGSNHTATSITGGNTLVFGVAHGFSSGERIQYTSTTQNGLTQNAYYYVLAAGLTSTQCQLGLTANGSAITLTNGTGLTLVFVDLINQVGINTGTPNYTLDVNGDANVSGDIYISGVHVDLTIPVQQGQLLYVSDDVTPTITNSSTITFDDNANRLRLVNNVSGGASSLELLKQYTTTLADGSAVAQLFGFYDPNVALSSTNPIYTHRTRSEYDTAGNYIYRIQVDPTGNFATGSTTIVAQLNLDDNVLSVVGNEFVLNKDLTGAPTEDGIFTVNRGSSTDATLTWNETSDRWEVTTDFYSPQATIGNIDINRTNGQIDTNSGFNLTLDSDGGTVFINDNLNVDSGVLYVDSGSNEVGINTVTPAYPLDVNGIINTNSGVQCDFVVVDNQAALDSSTLTTTSTATVALNITARNAMTGLINIIQGANVHCLNYTALRIDSTTAMLTTYAEMYNTSALANFTADVSSGNLRLLITPTSATSTVFSVVRTSLT